MFYHLLEPRKLTLGVLPMTVKQLDWKSHVSEATKDCLDNNFETLVVLDDEARMIKLKHNLSPVHVRILKADA